MSDIYSQDLTSSLNYENTYKSGQIIYLYVKTHNVTGLKYLGKTVAKDPHKYKGSGVVWRNHCNVHGYDYSTEIIFKSIHKHEIKEQGVYYSKLWNVVESDEWANLKQEECDGGYCASSVTPEANMKRSQTMTGRTQHPDHTTKVAQALKGRKSTQSKETRAQAAVKASAKLKGRKKPEGFGNKIRSIVSGRPMSNTAKENMKAAWTEERRINQAAQKSALHKVIVTCPHCGAQGGKPNMMRCHFDRCEIIATQFKFLLTSPQGEQYKVNNLKTFCLAHGLKLSSFEAALRRGRSNCVGWTIEKLV